MARKIIIDCDPGQDDAVALLLAFASPDEIDVVGITAVGGNVPLELTQRNARMMCDLAASKAPVYAGCDRPMQRPLRTAEMIHGETGIDGIDVFEPQAALQEQHGVDFIVDTLLAADDAAITLVPTGPLTNTTSAPAATAASASAYAIFPELRLLINRTGSIASRVGPAVIITRRPASGRPSETRVGPITAAAIASGSNMRPSPTSPQAWLPLSGPSMRTPRSSSNCRFACTAGFFHMTWFIAGAMTSGASVARQSVDRRSGGAPRRSSRPTSAVRRRGGE